LGWVSASDRYARTTCIADAHRDGKRYIVRAEDKLTAFLEMEAATRAEAATLRQTLYAPSDSTV
jgi:hypothetical protein